MSVPWMRAVRRRAPSTLRVASERRALRVAWAVQHAILSWPNTRRGAHACLAGRVQGGGVCAERNAPIQAASSRRIARARAPSVFRYGGRSGCRFDRRAADLDAVRGPEQWTTTLDDGARRSDARAYRECPRRSSVGEAEGGGRRKKFGGPRNRKMELFGVY